MESSVRGSAGSALALSLFLPVVGLLVAVALVLPSSAPAGGPANDDPARFQRLRLPAVVEGSTKGAATSPAAPRAACGLPDSTPVWVDYGEGSLTPDVRAVFSRPGVVVATSGTTIPAAFRSAGAATVLFVRTLPLLVGEPDDPLNPALVDRAAVALLKRAQDQTACATPWVILNELLGSATPTPWGANTAQYRANVLTLMQRLGAGGARPVLLVHGNPTVAGDAAEWWRQAAAAGGLAYESYYDARRITGMGAVGGNRRMRLGMRNALRLFEQIGIPDSQLGLVLGFHSAPTPGIGGRQRLQPREEWLRYVKWNMLAARQIAKERGLFTVISWGWGTFGPESVDADKAAAACVYLWTRDATLCDGPAVAGPAFKPSLTEGQITLRPGQQCTFAGGPIRTSQVDTLARFTGDRKVALDALFTHTLLAKVRVNERDVLAQEQTVVDTRFAGRRAAYERALAGRHATVAIARSVIRDDLRRRAYADILQQIDSVQTPLEALADRSTAVLAGATCLHDDLPGWGWFPQSDARDLVVPTLARKLPFLIDDRVVPVAPQAVTATRQALGVTLAWQPNRETDLAGYAVYRAASPVGPWGPGSSELLTRPYFQEAAPPAGAVYVVRAVDTSGNVSAPSAVTWAPSALSGGGKKPDWASVRLRHRLPVGPSWRNKRRSPRLIASGSPASLVVDQPCSTLEARMPEGDAARGSVSRLSRTVGWSNCSTLV